MNPLDPSERLAVTLTAADWNAVLGALGEAPYRIAAPVVQRIMEQIEQRRHPSDAPPHPDAGV